MDRQDLLNAIIRSNGKKNALSEADDLLERINYLQNTGRYNKLIAQLCCANNKDNFLAFVFELNFAFQFESQGLTLEYEIKQNEEHASSIDFCRITSKNDKVFFELKLIQEQQFITDDIKKQLNEKGEYELLLEENEGEYIRLQSIIVSKVQNKHNHPTKFFSTEESSLNFIVIDASQTGLEGMDEYDWKLIVYGDPSVALMHRRNVFGLFQECKPEDPPEFTKYAVKHKRAKEILDGVLFIFREPNSGALTYNLEQCLFWNPTHQINPEVVSRVNKEISQALPLHCELPR